MYPSSEFAPVLVIWCRNVSSNNAAPAIQAEPPSPRANHAAAAANNSSVTTYVDEENSRQLGSGRAREAREQVVGQPCAHLRREQDPVARKQRRIHPQRDRGSVECLIGRAVAVSTGVGRRQQHEQHARGGRTRQAAHMFSSAVWP